MSAAGAVIAPGDPQTRDREGLTQPNDTVPESTDGYGRSIPERLANRVEMVVPGRHDERLRDLIERVDTDDDLYALWIAAT